MTGDKNAIKHNRKKAKQNFHDVPLLVTVTKVREECYRGYKERDKFVFENFTKTPKAYSQ